MRASGASELRTFSHFHILKLLFPSIFCWYFRYTLSEIYTFSGLKLYMHTYTINAVSFYFLWYGAIYKRQCINKTLTFRKYYVYASERAERASLEHFAFSHSKTSISFNILLVLQLSCRYKWHACRLTCTDKFPNVPTKLRKSIIGGLLPPPPPSGYASALWL